MNISVEAGRIQAGQERGSTMKDISLDHKGASMDFDIDIEVMMKTYGNAVYRTCRLMLGDSALAEDAAQETFIKAYEKYYTLNNKDSEKAWLFRIATNTCRNYQRSSWNKKVSLGLDMEGEAPPEIGYIQVQREAEGNAETLLMKNESKKRMLDAVSKLKEKYREVILLYFYHDFNTAEIADILEIKEPAVRKRLSRGKDSLKKTLEGVEFYG